jgi:predicted nucleic acid-binding protein
MRRVLVDVNVILDVLLDRQPHVAASVAVWTAIESGEAEGLLAAHAINTIHYLVRKELGAARAKRTLSQILRVFGVAPVDGAVIQDALKRVSPDFEDSVMISAARLAGCDLIITRGPRGFRDSPVRVLTPEAAVPLLSSA